jgi:MFS family permease
MHLEPAAPEPAGSQPTLTGPWWKLLNRYHWFVLTVAALGWLFDTMDQQLFNLARRPAITELLATSKDMSPNPDDVSWYAGISTSIFLMGWAIGGLGFGVLGDRIGRAKTMLITILMYSAFTGLSALSWDIWSFAFFRFLTGLGVGGEFAVGVALVAETMPPLARPYALGLLQALSAVGNISAAFISLFFTEFEESLPAGSPWRWMFVVGAVPALLAILIRRQLKEPERWTAISDEDLKKQLGSYSQLFGHPTWRKHALLGLCMASAGVVGLWGIGFFSFDLNTVVFRRSIQQRYREQGEATADQKFLAAVVQTPDWPADLKKTGLPSPAQILAERAGDKLPEQILKAVIQLRQKELPTDPAAVLAALAAIEPPLAGSELTRAEALLSQSTAEPVNLAESAKRISDRNRSIGRELGRISALTGIMLNIGAFFGIYAFTYVTQWMGRRPAFAIAYVLAALSTILVFGFLTEISHIFWMIPLMGFCQLALFGGFAIYFPELFPTHLRSTGTSFTYNVGRFVAAAGPIGLGYLTTKVFHGQEDSLRMAGMVMSSIFLLGIVVLPFVPETKGKPLPE